MHDIGTAPRLHWQWDEPSQGAPAASIDLTFDFEREGRLWVGTCRELSTSTYGRNRHKVHDALKELVIEHLNLLEESGERGRFFDEWGHHAPVRSNADVVMDDVRGGVRVPYTRPPPSQWARSWGKYRTEC